MRRRVYDEDVSTSSTFHRAGPCHPCRPACRSSRAAEPYGDRTSAHQAAAAQHQIASKLIRHFMASKHRVSVKWPSCCCAAHTHLLHTPCPSATRQHDTKCPLAVPLSWRLLSRRSPVYSLDFLVLHRLDVFHFPCLASLSCFLAG